MNACRRQADENITVFNSFSRNQFFTICQADAETGQVVVAVAVKAGHFSRFTAQESASRFAACLSHALDDRRYLFGIELTYGNIIEEKERFRTLDENIVNGHGYTVLPDRIVLIHHNGQAQFRTYSIRTADENGIFYGTVH